MIKYFVLPIEDITDITMIFILVRTVGFNILTDIYYPINQESAKNRVNG